MREFLPIVGMLLLPIALFCGCKSKAVGIPPMPDFLAIEAELNRNLDREILEPAPREALEQKLEQAQQALAQCAAGQTGANCDKREQSKLHLLVGDILFDLGDFPGAVDHFQKQIIDRYEAFESDLKSHLANMKINAVEREKKGEIPELKAGAFFLETLFAIKAYHDYAEMVRGERRLGDAFKKNENDAEAAAALARAQLGLKKILEYRRTFELNKRNLLGLAGDLGSNFQSYWVYMSSWEKQIKIPKI